MVEVRTDSEDGVCSDVPSKHMTLGPPMIRDVVSASPTVDVEVVPLFFYLVGFWKEAARSRCPPTLARSFLKSKSFPMISMKIKYVSQ